MKTYRYNDGSMIEVEVTDGAPDVTFAMGECHVGDYRIERIFHATQSGGESKACETWEEAKKFLTNK
jgi:hypothetical protein